MSGNYGEEDWISKLPDDILLNILSLLGFTEAACTSVFSKRWRYLWRYAQFMDFDDKVMKGKGKSAFVGWVFRALRLSRCNTLDEFHVSFNPYNCHPPIESWIDFAIERRVQRLKLDLDPVFGVQPYTFPKGIAVHIKTPLGLSRIKSLTHLCLNYVNITGELVEHFLSNCPLLEHLSIGFSSDLKYLNVIGSKLRLKFLEICCCCDLKSVEIFAPNLESLYYYNTCVLKYDDPKKPSILIKHAPLLVEVFLENYHGGLTSAFCSISTHSWNYHGRLTSALCSISTHSWHIETLTLCMFLGKEGRFPFLPQLTRLKNLTLRVVAGSSDTFLDWMASLIERAPLLLRFVLQLQWIGGEDRKMLEIPTCSLKWLKVVELVGFVGHAFDAEIAMFLIENAVALDKFIIDRTYKDLGRRPMGIRKPNREPNHKSHAEKCALKLKSLLPGVKFIMI